MNDYLVSLGDHKMQDMVVDDRLFRYVPRFRRAGGCNREGNQSFGQSEQMVFEEDEKKTTANKCKMRIRSLKKRLQKRNLVTVDKSVAGHDQGADRLPKRDILT